MGISRRSKNNVNWGIDTENWPYVKLADLEQFKRYPLHGCFITPDNGYGKGAVLISDQMLVNIPARYVDTVADIANTAEDVEQIRAGKAEFSYSEFMSEKYHRKGYRIDFHDVE